VQKKIELQNQRTVNQEKDFSLCTAKGNNRSTEIKIVSTKKRETATTHTKQ
jgi:hypothetical protein